MDDLTGYSANLIGGRWNSKGIRMLYTSSSVALAMLETLAHLPASLSCDQFCLITLELPDDEIEDLPEKALAPNWLEYPFSQTSVVIGDRFIQLKNKLALAVPSAIVLQEKNILLNPTHPNYHKVKIVSKEIINIDKRFIPNAFNK